MHALILASGRCGPVVRVVALCLKLYLGGMRRFGRIPPGLVILAFSLAIAAPCLPGSPLQTAESVATNQENTPAPTEPRALYQALNALRPDSVHVYEVKGLNLRRDAVSLTLAEGKLAFFQPLGGRITGAVFLGRGHVIATPRDSGERRSLARFLNVPILDQTFSRAYLRFDDDTASELQRLLQNASATSASDKEFTDSWGPMTANMNPWHSLRLLVDWLSTNPLPYFYAALAGDAEGPFDVLVDQRRDEQVFLGQPRRENGALFYDIWASFRGQDAGAAPADAFAPVDYRVDTTIADDLSLEGKTVLHLKGLRAGERVVPLELSRSLAVEGIKGTNGQPLVYFQNEEMSRRQILSRGNDTVYVVLSTPALAGEEFPLEVSYHGNVITDAGNGVEFVGERGTWYAHLAGENFAPFDLSFRWPKRLTLVVTGTQVESHDDGSTKAGRWRSQVPFAVAGFNLGDYVEESVATEHPTIALFANRELESTILARIEQSTPPPEISILPPLDANHVGTMIAPPPPPNPALVLKHLGVDVLDSIHFFEKLNGPFPYDQLGISQIPGRFGQGWPGLVYLSTLAFLPPDAQERAGANEEASEETTELMPFHEVVHQWWGNVTGAASYRDEWIPEGMANYQAILYSDSKHPGKHRMASWLERYRTALVAKAAVSQEIADAAGPLDLGYRINSSKMPDAYTTVMYDKATWVMHMLHEMLRDANAKDPDERFRGLLQSILTGYRFRALSTADFQRAVERVMTPSMDIEEDHSMNWFFDQWVRGTGIPHYSVQFQARPSKQGFMVTGKLVQGDVNDVFTEPIPIYAARSGEKPELLGVVVTTGPETHFHFASRFRPSRLLIDPKLTVLCRTN
jgi:hypothetical protein